MGRARKTLDRKTHGVDTLLVRGGQERSAFGETAEALYLSSGFVYDSAAEAEARFAGSAEGFVYSRYGNPTVEVFEQRLALLEGAEKCYATASGMGAVFTALFAGLRAGERIVASRALFGSCHHIVTQLLPRYGVESELLDGEDLAAWERALARPAKAVFVETPANPTLGLVDLKEVSRLAHRAGARVYVDNVFATPLGQRPLEQGADVVVYSATKHIDGQGRVLGGAVLSDAAWLKEQFLPVYRHTGPSLSAFNAWVLLKGLETLGLRVERSCATTLALAEKLEAHPAKPWVRHPFLASHPQAALARRQMTLGGTLIALDLGSKARAFAFLDALQLFDISNNLGDAKSLATHPLTTTHRAMAEADRRAIGVTPGLVRLSVGLEDAGDLWRDLEQALAAAG